MERRGREASVRRRPDGTVDHVMHDDAGAGVTIPATQIGVSTMLQRDFGRLVRFAHTPSLTGVGVVSDSRPTQQCP
jgi:hypothetical protein